MEIGFGQLQKIIALSNYDFNGASTEKESRHYLTESIPNSEYFWKQFIVPLTNRINDNITN